jgi:hypothetical protein
MARQASLILLLTALTACAGPVRRAEAPPDTPAFYRMKAAQLREDAVGHSLMASRARDAELRGHCEDAAEMLDELARKYETIARGMERAGGRR